MSKRKPKAPTKSAHEKRLNSARVFGVEPTELALARMEVMQMMVHAGMSQDWGERYAEKRWRDFAPTTELGKHIHEVVTQAVAKAKAARETT